MNVRAEGEEIDMPLSDLVETVTDDIADLPQQARYLPKYVSNHPKFTGN